MTRHALRTLLLSGMALVGAGLSLPAHASAINTPPAFDPSDFAVVETFGQYTLVNNSSDWYIYAFWATNPNAHPGGDQANRTNWDPGYCAHCLGSPAFTYGDSTAADFDNYVGPNSTSSDGDFTFGVRPSSDFEIFVTDLNGDTRNTGGIPEPTAWSLMIAGFGLAGAALRRRRAKGSPALG